MRYRAPVEMLMKMFYNVCKKIYTSNFYDFVAKAKRKVYYITNDKEKAVVVVDPDERRITFFSTYDEYLSCHGMFSGDQRILDYYGYNYLTVEELPKDEIPSVEGMPYFVSKFKHYKYKGNTVCAISSKKGQNESVVDFNEAYKIVLFLQYLLAIKNQYDIGNEIMPDTKDEIVISFSFNDEKCLYDCNYMALDSFDFLPDLTIKTRKDNNFINSFKEEAIMPGRLHVSQVYLYGRYVEESISKHVDLLLKPIVLYAATDSGQFEYCIYYSNAQDEKKNFKNKFQGLLQQIGLYDEIITDNFIIYQLLKKDIEALGIKISFEGSNPITSFMYTSISQSIQIAIDEEMILCVLDQIKEDYAKFVDDIINGASIIDEDLDEEDEENNSSVVS